MTSLDVEGLLYALTHKCICGHAYSWHARDIMTDKERCWHGSCTGDSCEHECKQFTPEVK